MSRAAALAAGAVALVATAPVSARTVDYSHSDAIFREAAIAIGAPEPREAPERGAAEVVLEGAERLDHQLVVLGIACSAWQVDNPLSQMVRRALSGWDSDGVLEVSAGRTLLRVRIERAGSDLRCVELRELEARCIVRTRLNGEAVLERPQAEPLTERFAIEDEQVHSRPGACGSLSRGAGLSGRAASHKLVEWLRTLAATR